MGFPFVAVEGQEKLKKAILLNYINPNIGGLLVRGEKGTAKTTLVRSMKELFPEKIFVNLPLHITEENLLGSLEIEKTLSSGKRCFQKGLLEKVHQGILYVDEINLLGDSILSILLETLSRGCVYVERDGFSVSYDSKFTFIATMNPEESELRSSLVDKFGIYVEVKGSKDIFQRMRIIKKRLKYEENPISFSEEYQEEENVLKKNLLEAKRKLQEITLSENIIKMAITMVEEANTEGNRAEIILLETAKAIAAFDKRNYVNIDDIKEAANFTLVHRRKKQKEENMVEKKEQNKKDEMEGTGEQEEQERDGVERETKNSEISEEKESNEKSNQNISEGKEENFEVGEIFSVKKLFSEKTLHFKKNRGTGKRLKTITSSQKGRYIKSGFPKGKIYDFALDASIRAAAPYQKRRKKNFLKISIQKDDIRVKIREKRIGTHILFVVDSSGSMGVNKRMKAVKGAIFSLLQDAYEKRDRVGLVAFRKNRAEELLSMTRSIELAKKQLEKLYTGGKTPLAEGLLKAYQLLQQAKKKDKEIFPLLVLVSDGRANVSLHEKDPVEESLEIAKKIKKEGIRCIVIDTEEGFVLLEMAKKLSEAMGAEYYRLENIKTEEMLTFLKKRI